MWHYSYGFWGFPFIPLLWLLFWFVVIFLFWGRPGRFRRYHDHDSHSDKSAEEVLADRFAHGEIDEKEYESRLEVLKKHSKKS